MANMTETKPTLDQRIKHHAIIIANKTLLVLNEAEFLLSDMSNGEVPHDLRIGMHNDLFTQVARSEKKIYNRLAESYSALGNEEKAHECEKKARYHGMLSYKYA